MQSRSRRRSQGRSRGRLDRAAAPTREQEGRSERPPCSAASGLWGRCRGRRRSRRGRAQGCHHWRRRANEPWGEAAAPLFPAAAGWLAPRPRPRLRPPPPPRLRPRPASAPKAGPASSPACPGAVAGPPQAAGELPALERLRRGAARGCASTTVTVDPAASPGPVASAASPGRGFLQPGTRPAFLGETPLGPARSTRDLLPATVGSNVVSPKNFWTVGSRWYGVPLPV